MTATRFMNVYAPSCPGMGSLGGNPFQRGSTMRWMHFARESPPNAYTFILTRTFDLFARGQ
jgi:hypothetical protein